MGRKSQHLEAAGRWGSVFSGLLPWALHLIEKDDDSLAHLGLSTCQAWPYSLMYFIFPTAL